MGVFQVVRCFALAFFGRWTDKAPYSRVLTVALLCGTAGGLMWATAPLVVGNSCRCG